MQQIPALALGVVVVFYFMFVCLFFNRPSVRPSVGVFVSVTVKMAAAGTHSVLRFALLLLLLHPQAPTRVTHSIGSRPAGVTTRWGHNHSGS